MNITMDILDGDQIPKRGDRLKSPKSLYYVIHARKVQRRDLAAPPRYKLWVVNAEELKQPTRLMLLRSAMRRDMSTLFHFTWYPRKKKRRSFEDLMRMGSRG